MRITLPRSTSVPGSGKPLSESRPPAASIKAKPRYVPFSASKSNVLSNVIINSLFGIGLYYLYKDIQTSQKRSKSDRGTVTIVYEHEKKKPVVEAPAALQSLIPYKFPKLSYLDLSFVTVGFGFLLQLANIAHVSFGKKSMLYRAGLLSVILYPPFTFYMYTLRDRKITRS